MNRTHLLIAALLGVAVIVAPEGARGEDPLCAFCKVQHSTAQICTEARPVTPVRVTHAPVVRPSQPVYREFNCHLDVALLADGFFARYLRPAQGLDHRSHDQRHHGHGYEHRYEAVRNLDDRAPVFTSDAARLAIIPVEAVRAQWSWGLHYDGDHNRIAAFLRERLQEVLRKGHGRPVELTLQILDQRTHQQSLAILASFTRVGSSREYQIFGVLYCCPDVCAQPAAPCGVAGGGFAGGGFAGGGFAGGGGGGGHFGGAGLLGLAGLAGLASRDGGGKKHPRPPERPRPPKKEPPKEEPPKEEPPKEEPPKEEPPEEPEHPADPGDPFDPRNPDPFPGDNPAPGDPRDPVGDDPIPDQGDDPLPDEGDPFDPVGDDPIPDQGDDPLPDEGDDPFDPVGDDPIPDQGDPVPDGDDSGGDLPEDPFGDGSDLPEDPFGDGSDLPEDPFGDGSDLPVDPIDDGSDQPDDPFGDGDELPEDPFNPFDPIDGDLDELPEEPFASDGEEGLQEDDPFGLENESLRAAIAQVEDEGEWITPRPASPSEPDIDEDYDPRGIRKGLLDFLSW